jgi:ABC-type antimicrobial peptide transport system permease subunit
VLSGFVRGRSIADRELAIGLFTEDVRRMPGVEAVAATASPLIGHGVLMNAFVDGATYAVTPGFFEAMGLTLIDGRWLTTAEVQSGAAVAVVSAKVATRIAGSERAVGRQIKGYRNQVPQLFTVVGVVADARLGSWDQEGQGQVYGPYLATADSQPSVRVIVRAEGSRNLIASLMARLAGETGSVQIRSIAVAEDLLDETVRGRRLESWLFGAFAVAALVIVGVGMFGLMAMSTAGRTREIGIRVALGAQQRAIVRLLLGEQLPAIVFGLAAGGLVAVWAVRFVKSGLYQLTAYDPRVWTAAVALMLAAAALGAAIPSLMASNTDPVKALHAD